MSQVYATPGVYIEEKNAFPSSAVAVATAVPAFIGYTEKHLDGNKTLLNTPTRITSLAEYHQYFGKGPQTKFTISANPDTKFTLTPVATTLFNMYSSLRLFFANGGSTCYIVSVGNYDSTKGVEASILNPDTDGGLHTLLKEQEPTMLVIPDAVLLAEDDCYSLQQSMLMHCGVDMRNRVALLDVFDGFKEPKDVIEKFRSGIGNNNLQWAAAYYPWVETTIVTENEVDLGNIDKPDGDLKTVLTTEAKLMYPQIPDKAGTYNDDPKLAIIIAEIDKLATSPLDSSLHQTLLAKIPLYKSIMGDLRKQLNILPPTGGMAGVISTIDQTAGVAKSPANVSMARVIKPTVNITNPMQEDLNLPLTGKAINAIRTFPSKGVLVWGARTLDGNSQDWRYLSVRRTIIMIEQSLKIAAEAYVFEPNTSNTWITLKGTMVNFLTDQWKRGSLAGTQPEDAFSVDIGLGTTMTPTDILDGIMNISIKLAVVRPAEFIVITIQQQMQKS
jgi:phage tail sheath protein FI